MPVIAWVIKRIRVDSKIIYRASNTIIPGKYIRFTFKKAFQVSFVAVNIMRVVAVITANAMKILRPMKIERLVGFLVFEE